VSETTPRRPKNVVILDADNPLVEIHGEFFWREDHEQLVAAARAEAYRDGYNRGWSEATQRTPVVQQAAAVPQTDPQTLVFRRRLGPVAWLMRMLVWYVLMSIAIMGLAIAVGFIANPH
jgi:hypothetical protein